MKGSYIHLWLMILAGTFLLTSCAQELPEKDLPGNGQLSLRLVVSAPAAATTRAVEADLTAQENRIDMLEVLFFADDLCVWHPEVVSYDATTGSVSIPQPDDPSLLDGTTSYTIWVVANKTLQDMTGSSLSVLENMVVSDNFLHNGMAPPSLLVMEGSVVTTLSSVSQYLGSVTLQRVFAKIAIRVKTGTHITPYLNGGYPQVSLRQYKTEAALISTGIPPENLPLKSDDFIAADSLTTDQWLTTDYPFYVCPYRWMEDISQETYIVVKIPQTVEGITRDHYYKVDFNYRKVAGSSGMERNNGLERNHFYDLELFIDQPGGTAEVPLNVTGNPTIRNWTTHELYGNITSEIYLSLSQQTIYMDNVDTYTLGYSSSLTPVSIKDITYTGTDAPTFTVTGVDATSGTITITRSLPTNYQSRQFAFTVTNASASFVGLDVRVQVIQTPPITITLHTATKSSFSLEPTAAMSKNNYLITSAVSTDNGRIVAYPQLDGNGYTKTDDTETAMMVAPKLMMSSGITDNTAMNFTTAQTYCSGYWETISTGATYSDWRLPTLEELKLIRQLRTDNAIEPFMPETYYWDARSSGNTYDWSTGSMGTSRETEAWVRCVRDVKN